MTDTQASKIRIGFIGGGNMAQAIISGLINGGFNPNDLMVSDPVDEIRQGLAAIGVNTTTDSLEVLEFTTTANEIDGIVILAIKPQLFTKVLTPLAGKFNKQLVLSIAAGTSIASIENLLEHSNVVRAMPNTPALLQAGATGIYAPSHIGDMEKATCEAILSATGIVVWVDSEEKIHAVTAVSGSAPAYFFYMMEAMIAKGEQLGLTYEQAHDLTLQTAFGAAKMALTSEDAPSVLRQKVTSPNGTTHAAIEDFNAHQLDDIIAKGMQACVDRSIEMANDR